MTRQAVVCYSECMDDVFFYLGTTIITVSVLIALSYITSKKYPDAGTLKMIKPGYDIKRSCDVEITIILKKKHDKK